MYSGPFQSLLNAFCHLSLLNEIAAYSLGYLPQRAMACESCLEMQAAADFLVGAYRPFQNAVMRPTMWKRRVTKPSEGSDGFQKFSGTVCLAYTRRLTILPTSEMSQRFCCMLCTLGHSRICLHNSMQSKNHER